MSLDDALQDYLEYRVGRLGVSAQKSHTSSLMKWRKWIVSETQSGVYLSTVADQGGRYMERYFNRLRPPAYAPATFNNTRLHLSAFWKYCRDRGWLGHNPMAFVDPLPVPRRLWLMLSAAELMGLLDDAAPHDRVALALGMNTALRAVDIFGLKVGQVDLNSDMISVYIEKTKTTMTLPITAELRTELIRWMKIYAAACGVSDWAALPNTWTLVPPARNHMVNPRRPELGRIVAYQTSSRRTNPEKVVHRALRARGYPTEREGFHTLRRSMLKELYALAAADGEPDPIAIAQATAGHKHRRTTEDYIGMDHQRGQRDKMMQGKSFLGRAAEVERGRHTDDGPTELRRRSA